MRHSYDFYHAELFNVHCPEGQNMPHGGLARMPSDAFFDSPGTNTAVSLQKPVGANLARLRGC